ncbi:unnamed protein product [Arabidopsis arenosa]|uniref:F-box domain-containing protein n=1 Tax=Arabidopsis arenosa TaxID=38785 RepID=A0A8S2A6J5_ARAAE|nr:unnamed protein product [Arabidopsis arenosa]
MSRTRYDWSKLCHDLLRSILESLHYKDYHRARTVCSHWYTVSTTCKRPLYPWRITFNENSTSLFDPVEDKIHEIQHPGIEFSDSEIVEGNPYRNHPFSFRVVSKPGEYAWRQIVAVTNSGEVLMIVSLKGCLGLQKKLLVLLQETWRKNLQGTKCDDMGFKDNKLYVFTIDNSIKVLDFSGDIPREDVESPYYDHQFSSEMGLMECIWKRKVMITKSGDVMAIQTSGGNNKEKFLFQVFKMNLESRKWKRVDSLGKNEMVLFGHGVTLRTYINGGSIFFVEDDLWPGQRKCGVFDLATSTITWPKPVGHSLAETRRWLCDPRNGKTYRTRFLGDKLSESRCIASYGNWLLMLNPSLDFYVLNVFTGERINLPSLSLRGDIPEEIIEENPYLNHPFYYDPQPWEYIWQRRLAITTSRDVLIILSLKKTLENEEKRLFYIFKMNLQGDEWERVDSLGNEMLVFGDGYTLAVAPAKEDVRGGVIYFVADDVWPPHTNKLLESSTGAFDLATTEISWSLHYCYFSNIRWFVPGSDKQ